MRRLVYLLEVNVGASQIDGVHAAADVHAHNVRDRLIHHSHGRPDRAALAGVHVRHDADAASLRELVVAHAADLLDRFLLDHVGIADRSIKLSLNL